MKRKLLSKVLCGTLAAMTLTSGGMMYAGASNYHNTSYYFDFKDGMEQTSVYRTKENDTPVYMFCDSMLNKWYFDVYGRRNNGGSGQNSDVLVVTKVYYTFYVSPYYSKDECDAVAIHGMYGSGYASGQWSPDSL